MRPRLLSDRSEAALVKMYQAGSSTHQIASVFSLSVPGVCKIISRHNVPLRPRNTAPLAKEAVLTEYNGTRVYVASPYVHNVHTIMATHKLSHADARYYWQNLDPTYKAVVLWVDDLDRPGVERMLAHKAGTAERICSARDCTIVTVDKTVADEFYNTWHIQGVCNGTHTIGLEFANKLVACMTFNSGSACRGNSAEHLLQRFAAIGSIPGAASKLLKAFRTNSPGSILSYSDSRYAVGGLYATLGFQQTVVNDPDYRYWNPEKKQWFNKSRYQLKTLRPLMEAMNKPWEGLTEWEMAYEVGLHRCYELEKLTWLLP